MNYLSFFRKNPGVLVIGFMLTFFSSFGQTFLISLFVPDIMKELAMSKSTFGSVYGAATILSSMTLAYVGKYADTMDIRKYTAATLLLLAISSAVTAVSVNIVLVFVGFWGLRLAGQGLMSHISSTSISKIFNSERGSALSITSLGFAAGEMVFPVIAGILILYSGWRFSMFVNAITALLLIPVIYIFMTKVAFHKTGESNIRKVRSQEFSRKDLFGDLNFYIIALCSSVIPFVVTGLFFHQGALAQFKEWPMTLLATCMTGYASARAVFSIVGGRLIDRFSARVLFPVFLMIFGLALLTVTFFACPVAAAIYLFLTGTAIGISGPVKTAVLAEYYGTENIGGIRSLFSTLMVLCTAVSPALFGLILDNDLPFTYITGGSFILVTFCIGAGYRLSIASESFLGSEA
ncbi:MAG TPA: MFS transporter [Spirochaetota bacterium]|nr:MFS transporter [Spirochaetota bacterium]